VGKEASLEHDTVRDLHFTGCVFYGEQSDKLQKHVGRRLKTCCTHRCECFLFLLIKYRIKVKCIEKAVAGGVHVRALRSTQHKVPLFVGHVLRISFVLGYDVVKVLFWVRIGVRGVG